MTQAPEIRLSLINLGPIKAPLSVPPAMIVYSSPHSSPLIDTVALPLTTTELSIV